MTSVSEFQPPNCDASATSTKLSTRRKRQTVELDETRGVLYDTDREDLKVKVYSGLYVNEASDLDDDSLDDAEELVKIKSYFNDPLFAYVLLYTRSHGCLRWVMFTCLKECLIQILQHMFLNKQVYLGIVYRCPSLYN